MKMPIILVVSVALTGAGCSQTMKDGSELSRKRVTAKSEPNELVADDWSRCAVSRSKFEETEVGDRVWCIWRGEMSAPR